MLRYFILLTIALAAASENPVHAQRLQGQSFESVLGHPHRRDSLRLWHRYLTDSTLVLLIPREANPCLQRGYEFFIPIGRISNPALFTAWSEHRDSLTISCTASDYFSSGYRMLFVRERSGYRFCRTTEFQIFRSGVERICQVPLRSTEKADRRIVRPVGGYGPCAYIYHRQLLASFPNCFYLLAPGLSR